MKQYKRLAQYCEQNGIIYNEETDQKFRSFYDLLIEKNKVMNLTTITEPEEVELKHFIDSLAAAPYINECFDEIRKKEHDEYR